MSQFSPISQFISSKDNNRLNEKPKNNLIEYIDISKGKMITLLKTVFSFLNDNSLLKKDSSSSFEKYIIDNQLIQTMTKIFYFYSSNFPENGKNTLHQLLKEKYVKFQKFCEQNSNYISTSKELLFRIYQIQGLLLLWLIETKYDTEYYDELIRLVNCCIRLSENNISLSNNESNDINYLKKFLDMILKFPFIKNNKEIIIKVLEVNECSDSIINYFTDNLNELIKKNNSIHKQNIFDDKLGINIGKKNIKSKNENSYFSLIKDNSSFSHRRQSYSNTNSQKGLLSTINSSGFYTPEFKHSKRDSLRHFRRFTINNINNPKVSFPSKDNNFSRTNSINEMKNLLEKCEEGKHKTNIKNSMDNKQNKNAQKSTKSKLRLAVQGHFYTEDDYKNNIDMNRDGPSLNSIDTDVIKNDIHINNYEFNDDSDNENENEIENQIVSVDELPINPNMSIMSSSNGKNISIEPDNIIQETKEEEEIDENEQIKDNHKNNTNKDDSNYVKILTDNEIKDFFSQQFSDNKNNKKEQKLKNTNNNNINNAKNYKIKVYHNKNKKSNSSSSTNTHHSKNNNASRNNSINNNCINKKNEIVNKNRQNSKKNINITSNIERDKSNNKDNNNISVQEKMKKYSNNCNVFGMIKNQKNIKKEKVLLNKDDNVILQPCTKGKELMNDSLNHLNNETNISKERLPTDSVAKQNLLSLYQQLKAKK
jgi:hypothetical protein